MTMSRTIGRAGLLALALAASGTGPARADAVADFYQGKTITIYVGFSAGGGFDLCARLVAAHYGPHIPGHPTVVVKNMPGGGTRKAAAYLANASAQDGTTLGVFVDSLTIDTLLRPDPKFSVEKFAWIGRITTGSKLAFLWHTAPATSVRDAIGKKLNIAAISPTSTSAMIPLVLNDIVGTRFEPIVGYRGSSSMALAAERGETDGGGAIGLDALETVHADWMREKKIHLLYIASVHRNKALPDVPALPEFAKTDKDRKVLTALGSGTEVGRALAGEPRIPKAREAALRRAFDALVKDPAFLADAAKRKIEVEPLDGTALQSLVAEVAAMPKPIVDSLKAAVKNDAKVSGGK